MAEDGEPALEVCEEGVRLLESLGSECVSVIAVAGKYRTGKSFFLNRLVSSSIAFGVGETTEPCTRGIWLWSPDPAIKCAADGSRLLLMDTEGLSSPDKTESFDAKIFALALLLASYFVLNVTGVIDDATIERLFLVTELSKRIRVGPQQQINNDDAQVAEEMPPLLVLVRDFALLPKRDGVAISDNEYLEEALRQRGGPSQRQARRDETRRSLRSMFPVRSCVTLVRPCNDEDSLRRASELDDISLRPQFAEKMKQLRRTLIGDSTSKNNDQLLKVPCARRKQVLGSAVSGPMLAQLAQAHVTAVNQGAAPCIRGAWDAAAEQISARALENALAVVEKECSNISFEQFTDRWHFENWFKDQCTDEARNIFEAEAVDNHVATRKAKRKLRTQIESRRQALFFQLHQASIDACRQNLQDVLQNSPIDGGGGEIWLDAVSTALQQKISPLLSSLKGPARSEIFLRSDKDCPGLFFAPGERFAAELIARPAVNVVVTQAHEAALAAQAKVDAVTAELNATRSRLDLSQQRQDELTARCDALEEARNSTSKELEDARAENYKLRQAAAELKAETAKLSVRLDDARAAVAANAAIFVHTEKQLALANASYTELQAAAEDAAILAQETADAKEATHAMDLLRLAQETTASLHDAALADKTATIALANERHVSDLANHEAAAFCLAQCVAAVEALHKREYDERRRAIEKERAIQACLASTKQQQNNALTPQGVTERFAKIGQLFSKGHEKVESVAKTFFQRIDDELNDEED